MRLLGTWDREAGLPPASVVVLDLGELLPSNQAKNLSSNFLSKLRNIILSRRSLIVYSIIVFF